MKALFGALMFGAVLAAPAMAQESGAPLRVEAGQQYTVAIQETQTVTTAGSEAASVTGDVVYRLDIIAPDRWRYTPISVSYSDFSSFGQELETAGMDFALVNQAMSSLIRVMTDIGFECRVDAVGRCVEWTNWPTWKARAEDLVLAADAFASIGQNFTQQSMGGAGAPKAGRTPQDEPAMGMAEAPPFNWNEMRVPVLTAIASLLDGVDDASAATMMGAFHPAAAVQGRVMRVGATEQITEQWAMPFRAPPIAVSGTLRLESVDRRANTATFVRSARVDEASARSSAQAMSNYLINTVLDPLAPLMAQNGTDQAGLMSMVEAMLPQLGLSFEETTQGVVDLNTGMARQTTTNYVLRMTGPEADPAQAVVVNARYVMQITPGAPVAPRLPRAAQ